MSGLKNSNNDSLKHHFLYKLKTPPWKETFREKCFQRLKASRGQLVDKFRGLGLSTNEGFDVLMAEDWKSIRKEKNHLPSLLTRDVGGELNDLEINEFLGIMEEIQEELLEEERKLLEEYNAASEDNLTSAVDCLEKEVICPICKKNPMHQNHSIIFCACGVRIDVQLSDSSQYPDGAAWLSGFDHCSSNLQVVGGVGSSPPLCQDGLTLQHLKTELFKGLETHEQICCATPSFSLIHFSDTTNLTITCGVCNFMYIVI